MPAVVGYKVYGLSSDGGEEISGVLIIKDGQVVYFGSSCEEGDHRHVHDFVAEGRHIWSETVYDTNNPKYDTPNDDGTNSGQKIAKIFE